MQWSCCAKLLLLLNIGLVAVVCAHRLRSVLGFAKNPPSLPTYEESEAAKRRFKIARNLVTFPKARRTFQCTVVDGVRAVRGALTQEQFYPINVFVNRDREKPDVMSCVEALKTRWPSVMVIRLGESYMKLLRTGKMPPSMVVVAATPSWDSEFDNIGGVGSMSKILVLDNLKNPNNVGALARSASAFEFSNIVTLNSCADPYSPKSVRAASGYSLGLPIRSMTESDCIRVFEQIVGLGGSVKLAASRDMRGWHTYSRHKVSWKPPFALILGSEARGFTRSLMEKIAELRVVEVVEEAMAKPLSPESYQRLSKPDDTETFHSVSVPVGGHVESLNVAVAGSLLMGDSFGSREWVTASPSQWGS